MLVENRHRREREIRDAPVKENHDRINSIYKQHGIKLVNNGSREKHGQIQFYLMTQKETPAE